MTPMRRNLVAFAGGLLFAAGLGLAGMTKPAKVEAFLDVTGDWDPSLMLVMGGALAVVLFGYRAVLRRPAPMLGARFFLPAKTDVDLPLVAGSLVFGAGWGIAGYCPGPALTALSTLSNESILFVLSMIIGGFAHRLVAPAAR